MDKIHPNNYGNGLKIMYLGSIYINTNVRVGRNCSIHMNTPLVANGNKVEVLLLGDDCVIVVRAGSVVTKSFVENHITIAGVPARIISRKALI